MSDASARGRLSGGCPQKLSQGDADVARYLYLVGYGPRRIARLFEVSERSITDVVNGRYWKSRVPLAALLNRDSRELDVEAERALASIGMPAGWGGIA